jgi:hypothetical protein
VSNYLVQIEHLFALLDPGFDGLPAVVLLEPARQIFGHPIRAKMKQGAVFEGLAGIEALQSHIQRGRALLERRIMPAHQFLLTASTSSSSMKSASQTVTPYLSTHSTMYQ